MNLISGRKTPVRPAMRCNLSVPLRLGSTYCSCHGGHLCGHKRTTPPAEWRALHPPGRANTPKLRSSRNANKCSPAPSLDDAASSAACGAAEDGWHEKVPLLPTLAGCGAPLQSHLQKRTSKAGSSMSGRKAATGRLPQARVIPSNRRSFGLAIRNCQSLQDVCHAFGPSFGLECVLMGSCGTLHFLRNLLCLRSRDQASQHNPDDEASELRSMPKICANRPLFPDFIQPLPGQR